MKWQSTKNNDSVAPPGEWNGKIEIFQVATPSECNGKIIIKVIYYGPWRMEQQLIRECH